MPTQQTIDMGGNNLIVNKLYSGATVPGTTGTEVTSVDLDALTGVTAGTVIADKAIITDANKDITGGRHITVSGTVTAEQLTSTDDITATGTVTGADLVLGATTLSEANLIALLALL